MEYLDCVSLVNEGLTYKECDDNEFPFRTVTAVTYSGCLLKSGGTFWISASISIRWGFHPGGGGAQKHWEEETLRYPDPFCRDLTAAFSAAFQTDPETEVFGNGATELIYLLPRVLRPKRLLVPAPCFSEYGRAAAEAGIPVDSLPLSAERGFQPEPDGIARAAGTGTMIFWGHPNNP